MRSLPRSLPAAALALFAACSATGQKSDAPPPAAGGGAPLAIVDGQTLTDADLKIRGELIRLEQEAYQVRMQALEEAIAERLIAAEAGRRGVSVDELVQSEISSKVSDPTPLEIEGFYEQQKARIRQPLEDVRDQVAEVLRTLRERDVRQKFVETLRGDGKVRILLDPPRMSTDLTGAPFRGPENAPVTIVEFSDFQCPFCRRVQPTLDQLQQTYGDKLRWSFKDLPLVNIHPEALKAAEAARCAGEEDKFWEYRAALFEASRIDRALFDSTAERVGLDSAKFAACLDSDRHGPAVMANLAEAGELGLNGTPAFLVNGVLLSGAQPFEAFAEVIDRELERQSAAR